MKRLAADVMLGRLASWLRLLGHDTQYSRSSPDDELLAALADDPELVLLTRDRALARRAGDRAVLVRATDWREQLREVVAALGLEPKIRPFRRCLRCNDPLQPLGPGETAALPAWVGDAQRPFARCPRCGRVYWAGSHLDRAGAELRRLFEEGREPP